MYSYLQKNTLENNIRPQQNYISSQAITHEFTRTTYCNERPYNDPSSRYKYGFNVCVIVTTIAKNRCGKYRFIIDNTQNRAMIQISRSLTLYDILYF